MYIYFLYVNSETNNVCLNYFNTSIKKKPFYTEVKNNIVPYSFLSIVLFVQIFGIYFHTCGIRFISIGIRYKSRWY